MVPLRCRVHRYGEHILGLNGVSSYLGTLCILSESALATIEGTKAALLASLYKNVASLDNVDYSQISLILAPEGDIIASPCELKNAAHFYIVECT